MRIALVVLAALCGMIDTGLAQTVGPGGVILAPGPSQPHDFTPGGIGPGGVLIAPGPAARDVNIDRIGPGGGLLAPGPAGSVGTGPTPPRTTVLGSSPPVAFTIKSKRRHLRRTPRTVR
jgi:hypothetical protein